MHVCACTSVCVCLFVCVCVCVCVCMCVCVCREREKASLIRNSCHCVMFTSNEAMCSYSLSSCCYFNINCILRACACCLFTRVHIRVCGCTEGVLGTMISAKLTNTVTLISTHRVYITEAYNCQFHYYLCNKQDIQVCTEMSSSM